MELLQTHNFINLFKDMEKRQAQTMKIHLFETTQRKRLTYTNRGCFNFNDAN